MHRRYRVSALASAIFASLAAWILAPAPANAQSTGGTRLLRTPSVGATHIAFAYANNIWVVDRATLRLLLPRGEVRSGE